MNAEQRAKFEAWAADADRRDRRRAVGRVDAWEGWCACLAANAIDQPQPPASTTACRDERHEMLRKLLKWAANLKPDIELAQLANDGAEFRKDFCTCDPSVGMSPCQYCVIHDLLRRTLELSQHCAAALGKREERTNDANG